jgi:hypothetical protein
MMNWEGSTPQTMNSVNIALWYSDKVSRGTTRSSVDYDDDGPTDVVGLFSFIALLSALLGVMFTVAYARVQGWGLGVAAAFCFVASALLWYVAFKKGS